MRAALVSTLAFGLFLATWAVAEDRPRNDAQVIQGTWRIVKGKDQGVSVAERKLREDAVLITQDRIRITDPNTRQTWVMLYELLPGQTPKAINMKMLEGQDKGKSAQGIYSLEGDRLTICYALPGHPRPKHFSTERNDHELCFTMTRTHR